jgi:hypothetical protein
MVRQSASQASATSRFSFVWTGTIPKLVSNEIFRHGSESGGCEAYVYQARSRFLQSRYLLAAADVTGSRGRSLALPALPRQG